MVFGGHLLRQHSAGQLGFELERYQRVDESARRVLDESIGLG
jgi:hypothetical protein